MKKPILTFLFLFILYVTIGMLAPFYRMRAVSTAYLTALDTSSFYGRHDINGPDRAGIIETNQDALDVRLAMIQDAQEEIIITTFDIRSGPHIYGKEPYVWEQLHQLMLQAKERVVIHTPYLVCSPEMYDGLTDIAARVPQTEIMVNSIGTGDNVCAFSDYRLSRPDILATGITLFEYMGASSTHGKSLTIDRDIAVIGSYNFDNRSTYVDTETMFVIHSEAVNHQLDGHMNTLKQQTLQVNPDGSYKASDDVTASQLPLSKNVLIRLLSVLIPPFRFLI